MSWMGRIQEDGLASRVLLISLQMNYAVKIAAAAWMAATVLCSSDDASELFPASTASVIPG